MTHAEYERRRQISILQKQKCGGKPERTTPGEIVHNGQAICPSFAKQPDFRKYALKNSLTNGLSEPVFKVSINEIYASSKVAKFSHPCQNRNVVFGRKIDKNKKKVRPARPTYVPIYTPPYH